VPEESLRTLLDQGLQQLAAACPLSISNTDRERLLKLVVLLHKWNKVYNLTAIRDPSQMVGRHLLDSLVLSRWLPAASIVPAADRPSSATLHDVMDVGTGAGLPVLPLAIVRPDLRFLSVESNGKKARFQQQALLELGIANVTVVQARVETIVDSAQLVMSRAFTAPAHFLQLAQSLCAPCGRVAVMLGHAERLPESVGPAYELMELVEIDVPGIESARHVALCRRRSA
jgi:16S rRNA (guanine527-N7)-methyltransferase